MKLHNIRLKLNESAKEIEKAAKQTEENPTEDQIESGNYKKGKFNLFGMTISLENPKGSKRSGVDADGNKWETTMPHHYGYIKGTKGRDKDHLDVFIGPDAENEDLDIFVIDQLNKDSKFDEHKIMIGFKNKSDAKKGYLAAYEDGWDGLGAISKMNLEEFKEWTSGDTTKPVDDSVKV